MANRLKRKKNELLYEWCKRLSEYIVRCRPSIEETNDILHDVSVSSYIEGSEAEREISKKYQ